MKKSVTIKLFGKDITLSEGDKIFRVYLLNSRRIGDNVSEGIITKIGETKIMATFNGNKIQFSLDFNKSYKPNEYFLGRSYRIVDECFLGRSYRIVDEETKNFLVAESTKSDYDIKFVKNTISTLEDKFGTNRYRLRLNILDENPKIRELMEQLTEELSKVN